MSASATSSDTKPNARFQPGPVDAIRLDALFSGAAGLLLAAGAPVLDGLLGVPPAVLVPLGLGLLGYALVLVAIARAGAPARWVKAVIVGNALWVVVSVLAVLADSLTLTTAGTVVALAQAGAVALLAELQLNAVRRARSMSQSISL